MRKPLRHTLLGVLTLGIWALPASSVMSAQGDAAREKIEGGLSDADKKLVADTVAGMRGQAQPGHVDSARDPIAPPDLPGAALNDPVTRTAYLTAVQEYYRYRTSGFLHRRLVFEWQHWSSQVIFGVVLTLVAAGMYFAAVQFHLGLRPKRKTKGSEAGDNATELVAGVQGIRVRSPVLGVIILVISMAFFYLYLVFVYPIREVI
jgi:hypothetical protein